MIVVIATWSRFQDWQRDHPEVGRRNVIAMCGDSDLHRARGHRIDDVISLQDGIVSDSVIHELRGRMALRSTMDRRTVII